MRSFSIPEHIKQGPQVQMAPLIDIMFLTLILFMYISAFSQNESDLNITVPDAVSSVDAARTPGEIIVNITKEGQYIVNEQKLDRAQLEAMLKEVAALFANQQIIIRADEETYHKYVVHALDACARADIHDVSFATIRSTEQK